MSFLFPTLLTIGLPLVAVPVVIHLINLRRQQRVRWAAMQFLLESQRRNRRWILLKQLLLLAARMAIVILLVLMLAHLVVRNDWFSLIGRGTTHHLVLLDDSFSMSDRWDGRSAFDEGKRAVQAIADQASARSDVQLITLMRYSEAAALTAGAQPKVFSERINDAFRSRLESLLASWDVSQSDVGPAEALKTVPRLPLTEQKETLIVYLVGDFRSRHFADPADFRKLLDNLTDDGAAQIHLVRCVREARPNLAITSLAPESGVRAAGVEMWMTITVANYGEVPARGVTVQLEQDGNALPALALEEIPARSDLNHKFRVQFAGTGAHSLVATLPADAVEIDNKRYFASNLPGARPVLIIDGSRDARGGRQLSLALAPGGNTRTGWQPHVEPTSFLRDRERLQDEAAICLLDVPRLAPDELQNLESYVAAGGGVAIFVGAETDRSHYNEQLYRNGEGLFPAPLKMPTQLMDRRGEAAPDLDVSQHPLFQVLSGRRNSFLPLISIDYFYALADGWQPESDATKVIARLRNNEPLVLEKSLGDGRVVVHLTRLSSSETRLGRWSSWSLNPAFPVLANELVSYLSSGQQIEPTWHVGDDLNIAVDEEKYRPSMRLKLPGEGPVRPEVRIEAKPRDGQLTGSLENSNLSGIYDVALETEDGEVETRSVAVNVAAEEGDLAVAPRDELTRQLVGADVYMHDASDMVLDSQQLAGFQMSDALFVTLIGVLLMEQLLAYLASYHVSPIRGTAR